MRRIVLGLLVSLVLLSLTAGAQTTIRVPLDVTTIQDAINQAAGITNSANPTPVLIQVGPGTYTEAIYLGDLTSGWPVTLRSTGGPALTIIDSSAIQSHTFFGQRVNGFTLDGFTVRNRWDPLVTWSGRGMQLGNPVNVIVQNCHFDTTYGAIQFNINDPALLSTVAVLHNTILAGQGTAPGSGDWIDGQGATVTTPAFFPGTVVTGWWKFVVADNVIRSNRSSVRFLSYLTDESGTSITTPVPNGSLLMTGNDVSGSFGGGVNVFGGTGNIIAGNRLHHSQVGIYGAGGLSDLLENNLVDNNSHGIAAINGASSVDVQPLGAVIRNNTVVNNISVGIAYADFVGDRGKRPKIYNNIVAYNGGGGLAAVDETGEFPAFIPNLTLELARNDLYGNTLRTMEVPNDFFNLVGITNPQIATPNYAGVVNIGADLYASPDFYDMANGIFSLKKNSALVNAGYVAWGFPFQDFAGTLRDTKPDIGAFELVVTPKVKTSTTTATTTKKTKTD